MADPVLAIRDLVAGYDGRRVLAGIDLVVPAGRLTAIIGPNGHGKSTLLKAISGLVRVSAGSIALYGDRIEGLRPDQIVERGVIQVPQGDMLFPGMTVLDNLLMGAYRKDAAGGAASRLDMVFSLLPKLKERRHQIAGTLSGGERRMLSIGRGLMANGKLLLIDEPSLGLAPLVIDQIYDVIADLKRQGVAILLVEENASRVIGVADHVYLLDDGKIVWRGTPGEMEENQDILETYLGG